MCEHPNLVFNVSLPDFDDYGGSLVGKTLRLLRTQLLLIVQSIVVHFAVNFGLGRHRKTLNLEDYIHLQKVLAPCGSAAVIYVRSGA